MFCQWYRTYGCISHGLGHNGDPSQYRREDEDLGRDLVDLTYIDLDIEDVIDSPYLAR